MHRPKRQKNLVTYNHRVFTKVHQRSLQVCSTARIVLSAHETHQTAQKFFMVCTRLLVNMKSLKVFSKHFMQHTMSTFELLAHNITFYDEH
jgi:hypothetical protein